MAEPSRFHSPYSHWVTGLLTEIAVMVAFTGALILMGFIVAAIR